LVGAMDSLGFEPTR